MFFIIISLILRDHRPAAAPAAPHLARSSVPHLSLIYPPLETKAMQGHITGSHIGLVDMTIYMSLMLYRKTGFPAVFCVTQSLNSEMLQPKRQRNSVANPATFRLSEATYLSLLWYCGERHERTYRSSTVPISASAAALPHTHCPSVVKGGQTVQSRAARCTAVISNGQEQS